jgi:PIN domain nuclease of toxin-antitoxin system
VRLLLDTHVLLWVLAGDRSLSTELVRTMRAQPQPRMLVSAASLWEIAIKVAKGKLQAPADLPAVLVRIGFETLAVTPEHAWAIQAVSHRLATADPFDRLIFAQARLEGLTLATRDAKLLRSGLEVIPA